MESQTDAFRTGEGDAWYRRNEGHMKGIEHYSYDDIGFIAQTLKAHAGNIKNILEIGCSSGVKLAQLCDIYAAEGVGVDPSEKAIAAGLIDRDPTRIKLFVGTADSLPVKDASCDLVFHAFDLYLNDRDRLFRAMAETDRVTRPGGFIAILDFDPGYLTKRPYAHKPGVFSYKASYSDYLLAGGHYYLVAKKSVSHVGDSFVEDANERVSISILYKEPDPYR